MRADPRDVLDDALLTVAIVSQSMNAPSDEPGPVPTSWNPSGPSALSRGSKTAVRA
jgi:hypothetical protein